MIATRGHNIFVIGLANNSSAENYSPIVRRTTVKNINSISAIAYDPVEGKIIRKWNKKVVLLEPSMNLLVFSYTVTVLKIKRIPKNYQ